MSGRCPLSRVALVLAQLGVELNAQQAHIIKKQKMHHAIPMHIFEDMNNEMGEKFFHILVVTAISVHQYTILHSQRIS